MFLDAPYVISLASVVVDLIDETVGVLRSAGPEGGSPPDEASVFKETTIRGY
jgi:hypothetical protein